MEYTKEMQTGRKKNRRGNLISATKLIDQCDGIFSKMIRERDGCCLRCGSVKTNQAAHIASRGNMAGRWDMLNALTLCFPCHIRWAHRKPLEFVDWVKVNYPEQYERSQIILRETKKTNMSELIENVAELKRQHAAGGNQPGIVSIAS